MLTFQCFALTDDCYTALVVVIADTIKDAEDVLNKHLLEFGHTWDSIEIKQLTALSPSNSANKGVVTGLIFID